MNFSFWPFLWFGLSGRLLIEKKQKKTTESDSVLKTVWEGPLGIFDSFLQRFRADFKLHV